MTKDIDWKSLGFAYRETNCHILFKWRDGQWDEGELRAQPYVDIHIAATALHYGQAAFEGLKAFRCQDGSVGIFRPEQNAKRIQRTAQRIMMPEIPEDMFVSAVKRVVEANLDYLPPYGTGGSLYIRPLLFGSGAEIGLAPAKEYIFIVLVTPVGDYYMDGVKAIDALVVEDFDRAAPRGVGHVKVAGNYAAGLLPGSLAKKAGFPISLYLDAREHKYIDEFGTSNFIGITKDSKYVTPKSTSVLPSITNLSLMQLAEDIGLTVEQRPVEFEEIETFAEIGACGTAVVLSPIRRIIRGEREYLIQDASGFGPQLQMLYARFKAIQVGETQDKYGWVTQL